MLQRLERIYHTQETLYGVATNVLVLLAVSDGFISRFDVFTYAGIVSGNAIFNVNINGVPQFAGGARMSIAAGSVTANKTGLNIAVSRGDKIALSLEQPGGGVNTPLYFFVELDDNAPAISNEQFQDMFAALVSFGSRMSFVYNDAANTLTIDGVAMTDEEIQDKVAALITAGANTTVIYNDGANTLTIAETTAGKTTEEIQDIVAALLAAGSNVTLTYDDAGNSLTVAASSGGTSLPSQTSKAGQVLKTDGSSLSWVKVPYNFGVAVSDESTAITTGAAKLIFHVQRDFTLTDVLAAVSAVSTSGAITINIKQNGTTIFSTKPTIDASEETSLTAATPAVLSITAFAAGDKIQIDIDGAGTGAAGLKVYFNGTVAL